MLLVMHRVSEMTHLKVTTENILCLWTVEIRMPKKTLKNKAIVYTNMFKSSSRVIYNVINL